MRLKYFCLVVAVRMHGELKELREAHNSWEAFEEAPLEAYGYIPKGQDQHEFDQWVSSVKTHRGATNAFLEFE